LPLLLPLLLPLELLVELVLLVLDVLLPELALVEPLEVLLALVPVLPVDPLLVEVDVVVPLEPELVLPVLVEELPLISDACCCISSCTALPSATTAIDMPPPSKASSSAYSTAEAPRLSLKNFATPVMREMLHPERAKYHNSFAVSRPISGRGILHSRRADSATHHLPGWRVSATLQDGYIPG